MSHSGQAIRAQRIALGLTQQDLATRLGGGIRQADISRLENTGEGQPLGDRLALVLPLASPEGRADADGSGRDGHGDRTTGTVETSMGAATPAPSLDQALRHARQVVTMLEQLVQEPGGTAHGRHRAGETALDEREDDKHDRGGRLR